MSDLPGVPINALFDSTGMKPNEDAGFDVRRTLNQADVIIGRDVMSRNEFILFGREMVKRVAGGDAEAAVLCIELDQGAGSDDLEKICTLIDAIKGRCDYRDFGGANPS